MNHIQFFDAHHSQESFKEAVISGFSESPKRISPKFFYDKQGSVLFDKICELPEYYPTRTEMAILENCVGELADIVGKGAMLIELGSGASKKVRLLLDSLRPKKYMAIDISREFLIESCNALAQDYPWLEVYATCADFTRSLHIPEIDQHMKRLAFFPGSSIGNFEPGDAEKFLAQLAKLLGKDNRLLIGVDLKKSPDVLQAAYNDAEGTTAEFNLNVLRRMRRELEIKLDPQDFEHEAHYNSQQGRVEMHLRSKKDMNVKIDSQQFQIEAGEKIHTENSYKYSTDEFVELARRAGFEDEKVWTDASSLFSVHLLKVV
jgi:dimethylhistidine N-methyltransferase